VFAPAKTPKPVMDRLNAEIQKAMSSEVMKRHFAEFGAEAAPMTPDAFSAKVKTEIDNWRKVIQAANIKAD
jgi:tripartite-type tricarboxylate transporter receptor subunit TctC